MHLTMKLEQVERQGVSYIELVKEERSSFGITFADATGDQKGLFIKSVKPNSLAERCHALSEGDMLFSLNGHEVTGIRCKNIKRKIKEIGPKVEFELQYRIRETCISRSGVYRKNIVTTTLKKVGASFGFILRKRNFTDSFADEFPVISNIKKGGPADKKGVMQDGDRLLMIDEINLSWLTLAEVAVILMEKTEAKFTFEYNIREVDLHQSPDKIITLDVDIPTRNLGIGFSCQWNDPGTVRISNIYLCSVAERCGLFSLGDIILSVNDIKAMEFMALSKTTSQFQCGDQIRKLSFISTRSELFKPISDRNSFCDYKDKCTITAGSSLNVLDLKNIHLNTSASTSTTMSAPRKIQTKEAFRREQVKAIKMFCDMLKYMTDLKQNLSQLTRKAFEGNSILANKEDCTICNKTQHSVKLCASCISRVNVKCAQSMNLLRNIVSCFVKMSLKQENCLPLSTEAETKNARNHIKGPALENLMHSLTETLPKVFHGKPELQGSFQTLAHKISRADVSCNSCKTEIDFASLTVQRLLLLIYLGNPTAEINALINQLVHCLLETKLTCEEFNDSSDSSYENSLTESENASQPWQLYADEESTSEMENDQQNRSEPEDIFSNSDQNIYESLPEIPRLSVNLIQLSNYLKLVDISSCSESDISTANEQDEEAVEQDEAVEVLPQGKPRGESSETSVVSTLELNLLEKSKKSNKSTESTKSCKVNKDKGLLNIPDKICRLAESVLHSHNSPQVQSVARNEFQNSSKQHNAKSSNKTVIESSFTDPPQSSTAMGTKNIYRTSERNGSESNHESMESSKDQTENEKSHVETMQVNLLNKGEGFGFVFGFISTNFSDTLPVPIITQVKPNSPAHKCGVLAVNDRVLAINSKNMVDVPLKDLENMKRLISKSKRITLTIEFDVIDTPMKFGTFDVVLVKTLKIGLLFEDIEKGSPMVVSGVVKGSASHRSGKLFPADKVTLLKCFRNEEFNPMSYNYTRREFVKITVIRDSNEGIKISPIPSNSLSCSPGSNLQKGPNFIVKRASIHSVGHSDVLLLDQEVTLYRDPVTWDFGFLVGENPNTGRAYITDIKTSGPAGCSGVMKKFDRLVEVNGVAVGKNEACSVLSLLTQANDKVDLLIRRVHHEDMEAASLKLPSSFL